MKIYEKHQVPLIKKPSKQCFKGLTSENCSDNSSDNRVKWKVLPYVKAGRNIFTECHGSRKTAYVSKPESKVPTHG